MRKLAVIIMALIAMQVTAQEHQKGEKQEKHQKFKNFTPEQVAKLQTKEMALNLDLSETQQRDIEKIHLANANERQLKKAEYEKKKEARNGEKPSSEQRFKIMNERLDKRIANKKEMKRILSKEQFEKFEKGQQRKRSKSQMQKRKSGGHKKQGHKRH